ncbi:Glutathione S-transferase kappa, partial [Trichostrongylus colubriformis]
MASKVRIDLYYDVISPYSWIAFEALLRYQHVWPITIHLKPFSLGGIMKGSANKPPGLVKNKALYMLKDLQRNNEFWNMNLSPPQNFMKWIRTETSDNAMKLLLIIQRDQPGMLHVLRNFMKYWKPNYSSRSETLTSIMASASVKLLISTVLIKNRQS